MKLCGFNAGNEQPIFLIAGTCVIESEGMTLDTAGALKETCAALGVPFLENMLSWPPGRRPTDGVWAKYWYHNVERSTGFQPYRPRQQSLPEHLQDLYTQCLHYYDKLYSFRLNLNGV